MQPVAFSLPLYIVGVVLVLLGTTWIGRSLWLRSVRKALHDIYIVVTNHLEHRYSLARPQDKPGSDPGTKQLVFRRQSANTIVVVRIDWDSLLEKHYTITVTAQGAYCDYSLVETGIAEVQPTTADKRWAARPMTPRRARYLRKAVSGHYMLACTRQRDDTSVESISF
jgi:hypothetical protein